MVALLPTGQTLRRSDGTVGLISLPGRSTALQEALQAMLQHSPSARPSAAELVAQVAAH